MGVRNVTAEKSNTDALSDSIIEALAGAYDMITLVDNKYDLIFLDHYMPEMDGIETMDRLREQKGKNIDTPVIALTANAIKGAENIYSEHGFKETVFKPTTQQALSDALKKYL